MIESEIVEKIKAKSMFKIIYLSSKYCGEKRMLNILKALNQAINNVWELVSLYDASELQNQHSPEVAIDDFEDIVLKLTEIRETLFADSLNYDRLAEFCESQVEELDSLQEEFMKAIEQEAK